MPAYCGVNEIKSDLNFPADTTQYDAALEAVAAAVSGWIDLYCGRTFQPAASQTRYYTAEDSGVVYVDDVQSITTLATDDGSRAYGTVWSAAQYDLAPYNAVTEGKPYTKIEANGAAFPTGKRGVKVVGSFGWLATPKAVVRACALQSMRLFKRNQAIFGVVGSAELGQQLVIPKLDPDVMQLLAPLRRGPMV